MSTETETVSPVVTKAPPSTPQIISTNITDNITHELTTEEIPATTSEKQDHSPFDVIETDMTIPEDFVSTRITDSERIPDTTVTKQPVTESDSATTSVPSPTSGSVISSTTEKITLTESYDSTIKFTPEVFNTTAMVPTASEHTSVDTETTQATIIETSHGSTLIEDEEKYTTYDGTESTPVRTLSTERTPVITTLSTDTTEFHTSYSTLAPEKIFETTASKFEEVEVGKTSTTEVSDITDRISGVTEAFQITTKGKESVTETITMTTPAIAKTTQSMQTTITPDRSTVDSTDAFTNETYTGVTVSPSKHEGKPMVSVADLVTEKPITTVKDGDITEFVSTRITSTVGTGPEETGFDPTTKPPLSSTDAEVSMTTTKLPALLSTTTQSKPTEVSSTTITDIEVTSPTTTQSPVTSFSTPSKETISTEKPAITVKDGDVTDEFVSTRITSTIDSGPKVTEESTAKSPATDPEDDIEDGIKTTKHPSSTEATVQTKEDGTTTTIGSSIIEPQTTESGTPSTSTSVTTTASPPPPLYQTPSSGPAITGYTSAVPVFPGGLFPTQQPTTWKPSTTTDFILGPGACMFDGKVYVSAQQILRDDPCDFCFCFRGDIICLQQSCPPPVPGCFEEPIQGFCCPRYECPLTKAIVNITTTTTPLPTYPPLQRAEEIIMCEIGERYYHEGETVDEASGPCLECR